MNREPWFFRHCIVFIDRLHRYVEVTLCSSSRCSKGHFNCSPGFDIDHFEWLKAINTQVAEQANSILQRIRFRFVSPFADRCRVHTSFMTQPHFMEYLRFFIGTSNRLLHANQPRKPEDRDKLQRLNHTLSELRKLRDSLP